MYSFIVLYVYAELENSIQIFISGFKPPQTNRDFTSAAAALFVFTDWLSPPFGAESVHGGFLGFFRLIDEGKKNCLLLWPTMFSEV